MSAARTLADYTCEPFTFAPWTRDVYRKGSGPAVIIMHEMPGMHPLVIRFADRVAAAGMTAYLPSLFGTPEREITPGYTAREIFKGVCIRREFTTWRAGRSSRIVDWLRALARQAHKDCGGAGVGAVGMCFTGGFALAMMTEPAVVAPVLSQPSLPLPLGPGAAKRAASIDAWPDEIRCARERMEKEDLTMLGLRFKSDKMVPKARFDYLEQEFGPRFVRHELEDKDAADYPDMDPHSVLTVHLDDTDPQGKTRRLEAEVIEFFANRVGA
ncbi:MAG: dienelactone hydrolase family protein [Pseudomonadota bacterium]